MIVLLSLFGCPWVDDALRAQAADRDGDGVASTGFGGSDCDDADAAVGAPGAWYLDADGDGLGVEADVLLACAPPAGRAAAAGDCDDADAQVGAPGEQYPDGDGDGFAADGSLAVVGCPAPGQASRLGDCDDADARVWPGAPEDCLATEDRDCDEQVGVDCTVDAFDVVVSAREEGVNHADDAFPAALLGGVDVDGDGRDDVVASAPYGYEAVAWSADTLAVPGEYTFEDAAVRFSEFQPSFGISLGAADVLGDSAPDLLIGCPSSDPREPDFGARVLAVELPVGGRAAESDAALLGLDALGYFGFSVVPVPDAGGEPAVMVGAVREGDDGAAWLVSADWSAGDQAVDSLRGAHLSGLGGHASAQYGGMGYASVALRTASGSLLAVSAPYADTGVDTAGGVALVRPALGLGEVRVGTDTGAGVRGRDGYEAFGYALAAWDHDGDGLDSLVVSAPLGAGESIQGGSVYVLHAPDALTGWVGVRDADIALRGSDYTDPERGANLGVAVVVPGDMNGDGLAELALGAPGSDGPGHSEAAGAVFVLPGGLGAGDHVVDEQAWSRYGDRAALYTGFTLAAAGDLDDDGRADLLVGMPGWTDPGGEGTIGAFAVWWGRAISVSDP